jgi:hypothetical protein
MDKAWDYMVKGLFWQTQRLKEWRIFTPSPPGPLKGER